MRKQKAKVNFAKFSEAEVVSQAETILSKMTKNKFYPDPVPSLETVEASLKAFTNSMKKCIDGTKQDTAYKNKMRKELDSNLSKLGQYVNLVADGDIVKLDSSGFEITGGYEHVGILPPPSYIHVTDGMNSGELKIETARVPKSSGYIVIYSEVPAPEDIKEWHTKIFSKTKGTIIGLKSGTKYAVRAAAMSAESDRLGYYNYSDSVERFTQ